MNSTPMLIQAMRGGLKQMVEEEKKIIRQMNLFIKGRKVLVNNKKYEKCEAVVQEYYHDRGKECLRIFLNNDQNLVEMVDFGDCEFT